MVSPPRENHQHVEFFIDFFDTWIDDSPVTPRALPNYTYDPNEAFGKDVDDDDDDKENRIAKDAALANEEDTQLMLKIGGKQLKLFQFWKKKN